MPTMIQSRMTPHRTFKNWNIWLINKRNYVSQRHAEAKLLLTKVNSVLINVKNVGNNVNSALLGNNDIRVGT